MRCATGTSVRSAAATRSAVCRTTPTIRVGSRGSVSLSAGSARPRVSPCWYSRARGQRPEVAPESVPSSDWRAPASPGGSEMEAQARSSWRGIAALVFWLALLLAGCSSAEESADESSALPAVSSRAQSDTLEQCECAPEQFCVDGVCCDTPCSGTCEACTAALKGSGPDGVCGPIAAGADPQDECAVQGEASCGFDGNCDGAGACSRYAAGTLCREAPLDCDLPEQCPGQGAPCPPDGRKSSGTGCASDDNPCTLDQCDGNSAQCQHPAGNANAPCGAEAGECDLPEFCTGTSPN